MDSNYFLSTTRLMGCLFEHLSNVYISNSKVDKTITAVVLGYRGREHNSFYCKHCCKLLEIISIEQVIDKPFCMLGKSIDWCDASIWNVHNICTKRLKVLVVFFLQTCEGSFVTMFKIFFNFFVSFDPKNNRKERSARLRNAFDHIRNSKIDLFYA
jgi:hypothetical protein